MKYSLFFMLLSLVSLLASPSFSSQAQSPESSVQTTAPLTAFSRLPAYRKVTLSPSGAKVAFVENFAAPNNLAILTTYDFGKKKIKRILSSDSKKVVINWFKWINEDILLLSAKFEMKQGRVLYFQTRMFSVDTNDEKPKLKRLLKPKTSFNFSTNNRRSQFQDSVIDFLPDEPDHILVQVDVDTPQQPSVFRLNVRTDRKRRVQSGWMGIRRWITDQQHIVRIGMTRDYETGDVDYYERADEDADLRKLFSYNIIKDKPISVRGFGLNPNILYYTKYKGDTRALYKIDLSDMQSELILAHNDRDVSGSLIYSPATKDVIGVRDGRSPFGRFYFDEKEYEYSRKLKETFPDTSNFIRNRSQDDNAYIVYTHADNKPGQYYITDRANDKISYLFGTYPELAKVSLPHHKKLTYAARDGVEIEAYLTLPLTGKAPYPTVMYPHGGPGARDTKGFDVYVAHLASKGYAVLRPNFRGSSGYGYTFSQAQMGAWGLEMQDDITDAAHYLIDEGIANKEKLCIVGGSYGGYAATMATVKTPDLFACAVSFAGVTDLLAIARFRDGFLGGELSAETQFGDDKKDLRARSPVNFVQGIKTPILLMHGKEDRVVPVKQSRDFAEELEDANKPFKYVEFPTGSHNLSIQENRTAYFEELDTFLSQYLE